MEKKVMIIIDFNNTVFKSYYKERLINSKGENVNAIKGFFFKLGALISNYSPEHIVFAADRSRSTTFRKKIFKPYKANRDRRPFDPDIDFQMRQATALANATGFPFISDDLYEADDIMGMLTKLGNENNMTVILVSSDKDLYQLLNEDTFIMNGNGDLVTEEWLNMNYKLTPSQFIEHKMLMGDRGDNIPGIDGIGELTSLRLLHRFDNIESIYSKINSLKDVVRNKLLDGQDTLDLMRELVTIKTDYSLLNLNMDSLIRKPADRKTIFQMLTDLEIPSLYPTMEYNILGTN